MTSSSVLDLNLLMELFDHDIEEVKDTFEDFKKDFVMGFKELIEAIKEEDCPQVKSKAHYLKSSSYGVGAMQLGQALEAMEYKALDQDVQACKQAAMEIKDKYLEVQKEINSAFN